VPPIDMFANQHGHTAPFSGSARPSFSPTP
jgi:hypothetical protein